jgi:hypothetical protein
MSLEQTPKINEPDALSRLFERAPLTKIEKLKLFIGSVAAFGAVEGFMSLSQNTQRVALTDAVLVGGMVAVKNKFGNHQPQLSTQTISENDMEGFAPRPGWVNPFREETPNQHLLGPGHDIPMGNPSDPRS